MMRVEEKIRPVMEKVTLRRCVLLAGWLAGLVVSLGSAQALPQEGGVAGGVPNQGGPAGAAGADSSGGQEIPKLPVFVYQREGRPDPFLPFLSQEILKAGAKPGSEPMGIQKLEPGQLNLVAIVFGEREAVAMVQDSAGMGYVIRQGTQVGRSGTVKEILANKVLIEQVEQTPAAPVKRVVEMILREGEKE
ncbi:MAG: hypothetical protein ACOY3Z_10945 [Thermodesulfobacteriota bacterium]